MAPKVEKKSTNKVIPEIEQILDIGIDVPDIISNIVTIFIVGNDILSIDNNKKDKFDPLQYLLNWFKEINNNNNNELQNTLYENIKLIYVSKDDLISIAIDKGIRDGKDGGSDLSVEQTVKCLKIIQDEWKTATSISKTNLLKKSIQERQEEEQQQQGSEDIPQDTHTHTETHTHTLTNDNNNNNNNINNIPYNKHDSIDSINNNEYYIDVIIILSDILPDPNKTDTTKTDTAKTDINKTETAKIETETGDVYTSYWNAINENSLNLNALVYLDPNEAQPPGMSVMSQNVPILNVPASVLSFHNATQRASETDSLYMSVILRISDCISKYQPEITSDDQTHTHTHTHTQQPINISKRASIVPVVLPPRKPGLPSHLMVEVISALFELENDRHEFLRSLRKTEFVTIKKHLPLIDTHTHTHTS
eukprot:GHVR01148940.1.p1 GENE.GHVR01148940.1~~GHVR01148940.1.p1  ORF type:complete len:422 (+),score=191.31 GHVR01148940.1:75-1340(+)